MAELGIVINPSVKNVDACVVSTEGELLLKHNGEQTEALEPPLYFVPWITFDGVNT